jgi:acetylornithine deacetylase/succinyl-diaminopimelate desuccinylase-like protein
METFISEDEIIALLVDLVRIPSVNPPADTQECAELILRKFKDEKIDARIVKGNDRQSNAVARLRGQNNGKTLLLNGEKTGRWIHSEAKFTMERFTGAEPAI